MRVWIDLANSPHVPFFEPVVAHLEARGHDVILTARDHAQTLSLARQIWPEIPAIGGPSPSGRVQKGAAFAGRALALARSARNERVDVALSHGSYAQIVAGVFARVPAVTLMDYEHQPANHLSFRLARTVVVPSAFPDDALRRFGASRKTLRYEGFKEEVYLAGDDPDTSALLVELGIDAHDVLAVFRPAPDGALYHRVQNQRFEVLLDRAVEVDGVAAVVLPRNAAQRERYRQRLGVIVPERPLHGRTLLAAADLVVGAGGTMNREAALLGAPAYTVFAGEMAAVDRALIKLGALVDLRDEDLEVRFVKRGATTSAALAGHRDGILRTIDEALARVTR